MKTYTIIFTDGAKIENLTLNAGSNNFHSSTEITPELFEGKLAEVHIASSDGDMSDCGYPPVLSNAELVQITPASETQDGHWQFILREIPEDETAKTKMEKRFSSLEAANDDIVLMMADLIGGSNE